MGNSTSRKTPPVIAECRAPLYCVKRLGGRHLMLGGGGGAAKTGVVNQMEAHLLTFKDKKTVASSNTAMCAKLCSKIDTGSSSTMNMDVALFSNNGSEKDVYLIAAGHDQYCDLYETNGYSVEGDDNNGEGLLSYSFRSVARFTTDEHATNPYQKAIRFDKSCFGHRLVTGGQDGHLRVWDTKHMFNNRNPEIERKPITTIAAHTDIVEDIDISPDGRIILSIGGENKTYLWDMESGRRVMELPLPEGLAKGYKVRSARFTALGGANIIFVVAINSIQRSSKSSSYLALYAFNRERQTCKPVLFKEAGKGESISSLCVSTCGNYTGIGTLSGSAAIFDTHELNPLLFNKETHGIFVTAVEFLDRVAVDIKLPVNGTPRPVPGAAAAHRASLLSLSADQTVQLHNLPFASSSSTTAFLLKASLISFFVYLLFWFMSRM